MNTIIEQLKKWGCDTDCVEDRFMGDEEFFLEMLDAAAQDPNFEKLKNALAAGDVRTAFDCAHTLKGMLANMGLTPLWQSVSTLTEALRGGTMGDVSGLWADVCRNLGVLERIVGQE